MPYPDPKRVTRSLHRLRPERVFLFAICGILQSFVTHMVIRITACCTPLLVPSIYIPSHAEYTLDERPSSEFPERPPSSFSPTACPTGEITLTSFSVYFIHYLVSTKSTTRKGAPEPS